MKVDGTISDVQQMRQRFGRRKRRGKEKLAVRFSKLSASDPTVSTGTTYLFPTLDSCHGQNGVS